MDTYRLRVELPVAATLSDEVTRAISEVGGTVVSVDLHEIDGAAAVDELVVELPDDINRPGLTAVLKDRSDATVLSVRRCVRHETLDGARRWCRDTDEDRRRLQPDLATRLSAACPLAGIWLYDTNDAGCLPAVQMAFERRAPVVHRTSTVPDRTPGGQRRSPRWLLAVPDDFPQARIVALLTRPVSLRFTASEVARVQLLLAS